jgi:hypothetical protein
MIKITDTINIKVNKLLQQLESLPLTFFSGCSLRTYLRRTCEQETEIHTSAIESSLRSQGWFTNSNKMTTVHLRVEFAIKWSRSIGPQDVMLDAPCYSES